MNKRQLLYFKVMAEEGNITRAAARLHIPQPHLSNQLRAVEEELGTKLVDRSTRKFQLTDAGRQFQYRASQILDLMDITVKELEEFEGGNHGILKIGTTATPSSIILPHKLHQFHKQSPHTQIEVLTLRSTQLLDALQSNTVDIGLLRTPIDPESFHSINLLSHPMVAVAAESEFNDQPDPIIDLSVLAGKPMLVSYRLEADITEACRSAGFVPNIVCRIDDTRTILICASLGMGVTIAPADWLSTVPGLAISYRELSVPTLYTNTALIWPKSRRLSAAAKNFLALFSSTFSP